MSAIRRFSTRLIVVVAIGTAIYLVRQEIKGRSAQKEKFLTEFNPQLKLVREELSSEISTLDANISRLKRLRFGFKQSESKQFLTDKIDSVDAQRQKLREHLGRIEAEVEKGLALREINKLEGGGKVSEETAQLLGSATKSLREAREVTNLIESEMGGSKSASRLQMDDSSDPPKERKTLRGKIRQTVESITQQAYTDSPLRLRVVMVKPGDFLALREAPDLGSRVVSRIPPNASGIRQRGAPVDNDGTWLPIEFGGVSGFSSAYYLQLAQDNERLPPAARSEAENIEIATRRYPDLKVKDSPLNSEFVSRYNRYRNERPEFFDSADWPIKLAEEAKSAIAGRNGQ